jgi:hypothetical protein
MLARILGLSAAMAVLATLAEPASAQTRSGVNAGSLTCTVSGGVGFVFGSSKELTCLFSRSSGVAERYTGTIRKFGLDVGFTKEAQIVWLVFAPGSLSPGALAGVYGGATASATAGAGVGANVLVGGSNSQVSLQPVSVEGSAGLNVAAGIAEVELRAVK